MFHKTSSHRQRILMIGVALLALLMGVLADAPAALQHYEIFTMNADGSGLTKIADMSTRSYFSDTSIMQWSPDGRYLGFVSMSDVDESVAVWDSVTQQITYLAEANDIIKQKAYISFANVTWW